ncbi:hypothetical protein AgCh_011364 [Apium graveolens]
MITLPFIDLMLACLVYQFQVWGNNGSKIDGPITGKDFQDNQLQFSLLFQYHPDVSKEAQADEVFKPYV